jgi:hypothetical protein
VAVVRVGYTTAIFECSSCEDDFVAELPPLEVPLWEEWANCPSCDLIGILRNVEGSWEWNREGERG